MGELLEVNFSVECKEQKSFEQQLYTPQKAPKRETRSALSEHGT